MEDASADRSSSESTADTRASYPTTGHGSEIPTGPMRIAVLASGNGSNLQAIIDAIGGGALTGVELALVLSDKPGCRALERAAAAGVATGVYALDTSPAADTDTAETTATASTHKSEPEPAENPPVVAQAASPASEAAAGNSNSTRQAREAREARDRAIIERLRAERIELIVLAGYMQILSVEFVQAFAGCLINIHPSLLPRFPGLDAIGQALEAGVAETGVTVHYVDEGVDTGPVIAQESLPIEPDDTEDTLAERIHAIEHRLLPSVIAQLAADRATNR